MTETSRGETAALVLGDAALALCLGWDYVAPLLASGLTLRDLRNDAADLRLACHRAINSSGIEVIQTASDLTRRTLRLHERDLIASGPRSPRRGAPYTFVTTQQFLIAFDLESLHDLPDREQLQDAGLSE